MAIAGRSSRIAVVCSSVATVAVMGLAIVACGGTATTSTSAATGTGDTASTASSATTATSSTEASTATSAATETTQAGGGGSLADLFAAYAKIQSLSTDFTVSTPQGAPMTGTMWEDSGTMMRIDTQANGIKSVIIADVAANTMIMYQPASKQGLKSKSTIPFQDPIAAGKELAATKVKDLGTEQLNGQTCHVLEYNPASDAVSTVKMWLSESLNFPVQVSYTTADGLVTTMTYSNTKVNQSLPSDIFTVPSDVKIISM